MVRTSGTASARRRDAFVPRELSRIGAGIETIEQIAPIPSDTVALHLHGNRISLIRCLDSADLGVSLKILDLSGNQIVRVEGLNALKQLRTLNLAANAISDVGSGLSNLQRLETLNLSYNRLSAVDGLLCFAGADARLRTLYLHGNRLAGLERVADVVGALRTLRAVTFRLGTASNPICRESRYPVAIWNLTSGLEALDEKDADGAVARTDGDAVETELSGILNFLEEDDAEMSEDIQDSASSQFPSVDETLSSSLSDQTPHVRAAFPKIEAVLSQFRKRETSGDPQNEARKSWEERPKSRSGVIAVEEAESRSRPRSPVENRTERLDEVERQLRVLLEARDESRVSVTEGTQTETPSKTRVSFEEEGNTLTVNHEALVQKWKERSKLIDELEKKVVVMKKSWDEKEERLKEERNRAVAEREETRSQSAAIDAAFRKQLDAAESAHVEALTRLEAEKDAEIESVNAKLVAAEDEMRDILKEAAENKTRMDLKIQRLTRAFAELQS